MLFCALPVEFHRNSCDAQQERGFPARRLSELARRMQDDDLSMKLNLALDDPDVWKQIESEMRPRLRRMADFRLSCHVQGRLDASDVIQDAFLEAFQRLPEFLRCEELPFYVWLRALTLQRLSITHRQHLGVQARDARKEVAFEYGLLNDASSAMLISQVLQTSDSPSKAVARDEQRMAVERALMELDPLDREILILRHFEELTNSEIASALNLSPSAATNRYVRALQRLRNSIGPTA